MKDPKRVLFVNSEIYPYLPETTISIVGRNLPQGIQESGKEIRTFMPRYGCINERRNQLHEVIRLSGMNMVIHDIDRPLVIKVASISSARMQVYFIDNDDYFHRKTIYEDADGHFMEDNDERAIFFARGILEIQGHHLPVQRIPRLRVRTRHEVKSTGNRHKGQRHRTAESSYWHKSCKTRCSVCRCRHYGYGYCKSGTQRIYRCPQTACSGLHTDRPSGRHLHSEVQ